MKCICTPPREAVAPIGRWRNSSPSIGISDTPGFAGGDNHHGIQMYLAGIQTPMRYHDILSLCRDTTTHPEWLFFVDHPLYTKPTQA